MIWMIEKVLKLMKKPEAAESEKALFVMTTIADLYTIEGFRPPYMLVEDELKRLGGESWEGFGFDVTVRNALDYNVNHPPSDEVKVHVYNLIATALNAIPIPRTKQALCEALDLSEFDLAKPILRIG